jgi:hypothetical protein
MRFLACIATKDFIEARDKDMAAYAARNEPIPQTSIFLDYSRHIWGNGTFERRGDQDQDPFKGLYVCQVMPPDGRHMLEMRFNEAINSLDLG